MDIEKAFSMLTSQITQSTEDKKLLRLGMADLVQRMGFHAAAHEMRCNRKAKANAQLAVSSFFAKVTGERVDPFTEKVVYTPPSTVKKKVNLIYHQLMTLADTYLDNGSPLQQKYFQRKLEYVNAFYLAVEKVNGSVSISDVLAAKEVEEARYGLLHFAMTELLAEVTSNQFQIHLERFDKAYYKYCLSLVVMNNLLDIVSSEDTVLLEEMKKKDATFTDLFRAAEIALDEFVTELLEK